MDLTPSDDALVDPTPTRPTPIRIGSVGIIALVLMIVGAGPAFADEFGVGILLDPAVSETTDATFMEGFQLAVDQSPDVSHPAGVEGGDHLGSIDLVMFVIDDATELGDSLSSATDLIEREGVAIIVADVSPEVLAALFGPVTESETMLIATSDTVGAELPATPFFFAAAPHDGIDALLTDRTPVFGDAFLAAYGRSPSAAASRGYLAGRLIDIAVEATDRDPFDEQTLADTLAAMTDPATTPGQPAETEPAPPAERPVEPESSSGVNAGLVAIIATVVMVVAIGGVRLRSRPRR